MGKEKWSHKMLSSLLSAIICCFLCFCMLDNSSLASDYHRKPTCGSGVWWITDDILLEQCNIRWKITCGAVAFCSRLIRVYGQRDHTAAYVLRQMGADKVKSRWCFPIGCRSCDAISTRIFFSRYLLWALGAEKKRDRGDRTTTNIDSLRECCVDSPFFIWESLKVSKYLAHDRQIGHIFCLFSVWFKYTRRQQTSSQRGSQARMRMSEICRGLVIRDNVDYLRNRWNPLIFKWMRHFRTQLGRSQTF